MPCGKPLWANPKGDVALTTSRGLMLRSHDGGMNWARSHNGLPPFTVEIPKYGVFLTKCCGRGV